MHKVYPGIAAQVLRKIAVLCLAGTIVFASIQPVFGQESVCDGKIQMPVHGKIFNNAQPTGDTLGTVHLRIGDKKNGMKMDCGLIGQNQSGVGGQGITFLHTFVCNDEVPVTATDTIHSQLTVYTKGDGTFELCPQYFPPGSAYGSFTEISTPVPGTGRGLFQDMQADEGELYIEGTINCFGAIDMEFEGWVCLPQM